MIFIIKWFISLNNLKQKSKIVQSSSHKLHKLSNLVAGRDLNFNSINLYCKFVEDKVNKKNEKNFHFKNLNFYTQILA